MRIDGFKQPKSSFLSVEKDTSIIIGSMLKNERLKRLLYYTTQDALDKPNITQKETLGLIGKNIKNERLKKVKNNGCYISTGKGRHG